MSEGQPITSGWISWGEGVWVPGSDYVWTPPATWEPAATAKEPPIAPATMFDNLGVAPNDDCPPTTVCDHCRAIVLCAEVWIQDGQLVCDTCHG